MSAEERAIEALLEENRTFPPPPAFTQQANVRSPEIYERASQDPEAWWASLAEDLSWIRKWDQVLTWEPPFARWFEGGLLNASYNCLDRHLGTERENRTAIFWEGEPGDQRAITYRELWEQVCRFANVLKELGVGRGDRVAIYMPMVPELPIAMLACARLGAPHTVVFGGFSAESLSDRINDAGAKVLITADGGYRRGAVVQLKAWADAALVNTPTIERVVVLNRLAGRGQVTMQTGRDFWWDDLMSDADPECPPEPMESEDLLYILYTSGSTGKPKGIAHTTAGYLVGCAATTRFVFDLKETDVYWCTADIGWVTGHSYVVYGPLANGVTQVMYEGAPDFPDKDRFWEICERYGVTIFYTAPTAIRAFMKWGAEYPRRRDLTSLRLIGTVGEPINPEAWVWYHETIGGGACPVVDTWWQTETGHMLITPLPGVTTLKPGSATLPFPGIEADIVDEQGKSVPVGAGGYLVIKRPWPGMLRTLYRDPDRYVQQYWSRFPGIYFTGDGAKRDDDGYFWLLGRVDDVMNVAGHRISTMEVESALVDHAAVAEAAVIGKAHEIKGQGIAAFVTIRAGMDATPDLAQTLRAHVATKIGAIARPDDIIFTAELPKTRSGKIMRRLLRDVAEGRALGDTTTLADPTVVAALRDKYESTES